MHYGLNDMRIAAYVNLLSGPRLMWVRLRQAAGDPRGSHSTRPGSEMERMGRGAVWLTLKVPLTLSPH